VGSLCGCCKWCLLLLAGWCEGFCGVRVSEALATYVVLVPFLLVEQGKCPHITEFRLNVYRVCLVFISLGFIARGYGSAAPFAGLSRATLLALLADLF
jgi:hypothetical protein